MNKTFFRRHLPHLYFNEGIYFITSRLYDPSLFQKVNTSKNYKKINQLTVNEFQAQFIEYDEQLNNQNSTINYLKESAIAEILSKEFHNLDKKEYDLIAYTIMSNHFHIVFKLREGNSGISKIMQMIKGRSSLLINKKLNRTGKLWQDESFDRWVRDDKELYFIIKYILENPVKAGLIDNWKEWKFNYCKEEYIVL